MFIREVHTQPIRLLKDVPDGMVFKFVDSDSLYIRTKRPRDDNQSSYYYSTPTIFNLSTCLGIELREAEKEWNFRVIIFPNAELDPKCGE